MYIEKEKDKKFHEHIRDYLYLYFTKNLKLHTWRENFGLLKEKKYEFGRRNLRGI